MVDDHYHPFLVFPLYLLGQGLPLEHYDEGRHNRPLECKNLLTNENTLANANSCNPLLLCSFQQDEIHILMFSRR